MSSPEAGEWRAEITGTGRFWMEAQAQSDIYFIAVDFVKEGGRLGHEGLFRIQGQPPAGTPAMLQASLSAGATTTTKFYLVTERGQTIQKVQMHAVNSDREFQSSEAEQTQARLTAELLIHPPLLPPSTRDGERASGRRTSSAPA